MLLMSSSNSKNIASRPREIILALCSALAGPHLGSWVQCCPPWDKTDVAMLEQVLPRAMKVVWGLEHLSYKERLREMGFFSLEKAQGDLICVYKYLTGGGG